jgi:CelD/BcsL family acetyltransferase involved in cellulose biosynthesis
LAFSTHVGRDGLESLRGSWRSIEAETSLAFYQCFAWYECLLDHLAGPGEEYLFILASRGGVPVAVFPFQRTEEKRLALTYRYLQVPHHPHAIIRDVALRADVSREYLYTALVGYLRKARGLDWDALRIGKVPADSLLNELCNSSKRPLLRSEQIGSAYVIGCAGTAEENLDHLSSRFRRNLRRLRKRAETFGPTRLKVCRGEDTLEEAMRLFFEIEHDSWKSDSGSSIVSNPRLVAYYEAVTRAMHGAHECQINLLEIGGEAVAAQFGIHSGSTFYMLKIGYRQRYSDIGPGNLLLEDVIEYFSGEAGIESINLVTAPPWGEKWKSGEIPLLTHLDYRPSPSGLLAFAGTRLANRHSRQPGASVAGKNTVLGGKPEHAVP